MRDALMSGAYHGMSLMQTKSHGFSELLPTDSAAPARRCDTACKSLYFNGLQNGRVDLEARRLSENIDLQHQPIAFPPLLHDAL